VVVKKLFHARVWSKSDFVFGQKLINLKIEGLRKRTEYIDIFLFFRPSLNRVLLTMFCLLVEGECQILVF